MSTRKDLKVFEQIYNETYIDILKFIISKCSDLSEVDDIIQDTYLELFEMLKNEKNIKNEKAYIIAIARNKMIDNYKLKKRLKTVSIFQEKDDEFIADIDSRNRFRIRFYK